MARVAQGDREALRQLYDATSAKLFGVCLRILSDREESEDVLQDVYVTIWRRADRFDATRASVMTCGPCSGGFGARTDEPWGS